MIQFSKRAAASTAPEFAHSVLPSAANSSQPATDIRRELIRFAFQDTLRATGVPPQWLDCAVRYIKTGKHEERVQIQLVMKDWNSQLLRYALAFQNELMHCLDRYEPGVDHSEHEWLWRYALDCGSPFPDMPPPETWAITQLTHHADVAPARPPLTRPSGPKSVHPAVIPTLVKDFELRDAFSDLKADKLYGSGHSPLAAS